MEDAHNNTKILAYFFDNANNAILTYYSHIRRDAQVFSGTKGKIVVAESEIGITNIYRKELVFGRINSQGIIVVETRIEVVIDKFFNQPCILFMQTVIFHVQTEVLVDLINPCVYGSGKKIGRMQKDALLLAVVVDNNIKAEEFHCQKQQMVAKTK